MGPHKYMRDIAYRDEWGGIENIDTEYIAEEDMLMLKLAGIEHEPLRKNNEHAGGAGKNH